MASEYYKWLARDVKPQEEKVLTREEKWKNWWDYHKHHVLIGILCVIFAANMGYDLWQNARNEPDYTIAYVGNTRLPEDTAEELELALANLGEDLNGNGRVQVELLTYVLPPQEDPGRSYNTSMQLMLNIESVQSMIFLLEEPEVFEANYPILVGVDGTMPGETEGETQLWYRWADCPALAALEIPMAEIFVARRGLWNGESSDAIRDALCLWDAMTEGAK